MASTLEKITTRAKQLRKKSPGKKWMTCVKEASREYRGGKISGTKKKAGKKKKAVGSSRPASRHIGSIGDDATLAQAIASTKKKLEAQLGWMLVNQRMAKTKTLKRQYASKVADISKKLRALC